MILRKAGMVTVAALAFSHAPFAQAQVMQIGVNGEAAWVTGNGVGTPVTGPSAQAQPVREVPVGVIGNIPATANTNTQPGRFGIPAAYAAHINALSQRYDLSPALLEALVWQESRWRADAVSPAGARGLAQLMSGTARDLGVDPDDPFANLEGGARYLRIQLNRFDGNLELALAAYNAGPERVARSGGVPRIRETQNYVAAILRRLATHSRETR